MTLIGIDDTDSRELGMCTTYVGHLIVQELFDRGYKFTLPHLIRLNPAAKHKTRGNAAIAICTDAPKEVALETASGCVFPNSRDEDEMTNPGVVIHPDDEAPLEARDFYRRAIHELVEISDASKIIQDSNMVEKHSGNGRGRIGALAAIGAVFEHQDWTYECISYREEDEWGSEREVDYESLFDAADEFYPEAWDTVDRVQGDAVCVPRTPCPILYGIRGDKKKAVSRLSSAIQSESVLSRQMFRTNQGTDVHLIEVDGIRELENDKAFKVEGEVSEPPKTKEGGHVFFSLSDNSGEIQVVAFEPTKHFREKVRMLRPEDELIVCGEVKSNTLKLEKFAVTTLDTTKETNPDCPECDKSMKSAGANAGYRCRDCGTSEESKVEIEIERDLDEGWHEVPPCARRHISKPLIRGGFDMETSPFT